MVRVGGGECVCVGGGGLEERGLYYLYLFLNTILF